MVYWVLIRKDEPISFFLGVEGSEVSQLGVGLHCLSEALQIIQVYLSKDEKELSKDTSVHSSLSQLAHDLKAIRSDLFPSLVIALHHCLPQLVHYLVVPVV